ncbi:MAG: hypothetical protein FWH36_04335 [Lentimicrobiaceae bacterium]|nr:hypothetical protein [Lentimicrobiaceae bacterium]
MTRKQIVRKNEWCVIASGAKNRSVMLNLFQYPLKLRGLRVKTRNDGRGMNAARKDAFY